MTDTPLRRAARALMKSQSGVDDFDALDDEMQASLLDDVRAVLGQLREPSEAMIACGAQNEGSEVGAVIAWQDMIDAALSE